MSAAEPSRQTQPGPPGGRLRHELRLVGVAVQFLTRLPTPQWERFDPQWLHDSARHFATAGLVAGVPMAAVLLLAAAWWPLPVAVLLALAAGLLTTGAFHEDGLADTWDALGGSVSRERALVIMKDSRLGTYGTAALVMVLALKAAALLSLAGSSVLGAAALWWWLQAASRSACVAVIAALPYAGDAEQAKAKPMAQQVGWGAVVVCGLVTLVAAVGLWAAGGVPWRSLVLAAAAVVVAALLSARWLQRRLGGYTGDGLGATQQHAELAGLLAASALAATLP